MIMLVFFGVSVWMSIVYPSAREGVELWLALVGCGAMGLFFPVVALWERLSHRPAITVMADRVVCCSLWKKHECLFDEVKSFRLCEMGSQRFVNVNLRKEGEEHRMKDASKFGRTVRRLNMGLAGAEENIAAEGLTMKPQELCDLLNSRLK